MRARKLYFFIAASLLVTLLIFAQWYWGRTCQGFAIGKGNFSINQLQNLVSIEEQVKGKRLATLDLQGISAEIMKLNWVKSVEVEVLLSKQLSLKIEMFDPVYLVNGEKLLDASGILFKSVRDESSLDVSDLIPVSTSSKLQEHMLQNLTYLVDFLAQFKISILSVQLLADHSWIVTTTTNANIFLASPPWDEAREKLVGIFEYLKRNNDSLDSLSRLDLRYAAGVAIR